MKKKDDVGKLHLGATESLGVLIVTLAILGYLIIFKGLSPQVPLLLSVTLLMLYGILRGFKWSQIIGGIEEGIKPGIVPVMIFLMIGVLVATWIYSGTIPTIMYVGLRIISAKFFLPTTFIVCSLIALTCGSSFTTVSTMGIAFMGIGTALHVSPGLCAGAIVSGAFFGANVSPLSGTVNLAAGVGEVNLYDHMKALCWTDIPAWLIALTIYSITGVNRNVAHVSSIAPMMADLNKACWISGWTMIPVVVMLVFAWVKMPAIPSLSFASLVAVIVGYIHRPISVGTLANYVMNGYTAHMNNHLMTALLSKGGITSMLSSLALIIFALSLGGLLISFNVIGSLIDWLEKYVKTAGQLVLSTAITCFGVNLLVGEQYLSIILPGESFKRSFSKAALPGTTLTRVLNDAGGAVNAIVPWSVSGVFISGTLQINPFKYIPFAYFPLIVPIITIIVGFIIGKRRKTATNVV